MGKKRNVNELPSMDEIMDFLNAQSKPISKRELNRAFGTHGDTRTYMKNAVKELKKKGLIHTERGGKTISLPNALPERLIVEVTGLDSMGDLIARPFEWLADIPVPQIIITKDKLSTPAGIGDIVQVSVRSVGNNLYHATALRRITAGENHMVGVYENGLIYSVDKRLKQSFTLTDTPRTIKLNNRDLVIVDIPMIRERNPRAKFIRKIGTADKPFSSTLISIYLHNLPIAFTENAEKQAQKSTVPQPDKKRKDLCNVPFVTIDGADARDFDDAVWAEPDTNKDNIGGWHLMVAIADVAWYVRTGTALDMDARLRGNSVYFPDRVIPMLPPALSNGVCSLNPNEPRAVLVCEIWINANGHKIRHTFHRGLIQSVRRLTYDEVQSVIDNQNKIDGIENEINHLIGAYQSLKKAREKRGVLEIDSPEKQVILNKKGQVIDIRQRIQTTSMKLIEEMMILANVSAAETLEEKGSMTMYRVHDRPSEEKIDNLSSFLTSIGQQTKISYSPFPDDFNQILDQVKGTVRERAINELVLRTQSQAVYSPENIGHFGLALERYAHFTSPIRRYADIMVHRALIKALKLGEGGLTSEEEKTFDEIARHISSTERQAAAAEMDAIDRYTACFLQDKVGEAFDAVISSVTPFGLFLTLEPYGADGFTPFRDLSGDFYEYDSEAQKLVGRSTGKTYTIGDSVRIILRECVPVTGGLLCRIIQGGSDFSPKKNKSANKIIRKRKVYKKKKRR